MLKNDNSGGLLMMFLKDDQELDQKEKVITNEKRTKSS